MTTTDWIIDIALILIVVRQLREERLTARFVLLPLGIVAYVAHTYLRSIPTTAADLTVVAGMITLGGVLGVAGGLLTRVRAERGAVFIQAGWAAAALWIGSMTARLGFIIWISHSAGASALGRFSVQHHITGADVWQTALVLLALSEVITRIGVILVRGYALSHRPTVATEANHHLLSV